MSRGAAVDGGGDSSLIFVLWGSGRMVVWSVFELCGQRGDVQDAFDCSRLPPAHGTTAAETSQECSLVGFGRYKNDGNRYQLVILPTITKKCTDKTLDLSVTDDDTYGADSFCQPLPYTTR